MSDATQLVAAECRKYMHVSDPFIIEVLAGRDAILLMRANDYNRVLIETDWQTFVTSWHNELEQHSVLCPLVQGDETSSLQPPGIKSVLHPVRRK